MEDDSKKRSSGSKLTQAEIKKIEHNKKSNAYHKSTGYAAQKKYRAANPEKYRNNGKIYGPKLYIPAENRSVVEKLLSETGLTISQLFLGDVEEKYGVVLQKQLTYKK